MAAACWRVRSRATTMSETLDAMRLPLWGSRLIEASAGTGKTWTIAALYLRLILGAGAEGAAYGRPLVPSEILVLTFTRAATRELSDRIRSRLLQAARCFRGEAAPEAGDAMLGELLAAYPEGAPRAEAAWRLAAAAECMDDAAVHTIDAWCQRMLREHAFDSGSLFNEELLADERVLLDEALRDYWRQQLYPLDGAELDAALGVWPDVGRFAAELRELLRHDLPEAPPETSLGALIQRVGAERRETLGAWKAGWTERAEAMRFWLQGQLDSKDCPLDKRKLQPRYFNPWLDSLAAWAQDPSLELLDLKTGRSRLTPQGLQEALKPGASVQWPEHFGLLADLMVRLERWPPLAVTLRLHAAAEVSRRVALLKSQAGVYGFADMLDRLDTALAGPNGERLRERILGQYPVALIDEFQDTSPLQSRIFDRLYRMADNDPATGLLLIGDPKQSIYGFRGADIYSYLVARRATEGRHYVLGTNHRSTEALVRAVNHVFEHAEQRPGEGAFLFRGGAASNPLPFVPVAARGRAERLVAAGGPLPALTLCHELELLDKATSQRRFAARCAEQVVCWLNDERVGFERDGEAFVRLRPADIAVLVRNRREAEAVRRELRRRFVASVYLSDKDSVFASREAADLLRWLRAVAAPLDTRLVRAALATATVGLSMAELALLAGDDEAFERRSEQLRQLHSVWQGQGVLTMLRQTLHLLALPARWLGQPDGERRLTNFLHLAELLQAASGQFDTEPALIRWFAAQIEEGSAAVDEQIVRLESDADLVKVVTVHKSKGLEYPLVMLPFANSFRAVDKKGATALSLADADGKRVLHLHVTDEALAQADKERLREDLRLLYVALTRARHALWVGVSAVKLRNSRESASHLSALGYLLAGPEPVDEAGLLRHLQDLAATSPGVHLSAAAEHGARSTLYGRDRPGLLREAPAYAAQFERRWSIGSFSALVRHIAPHTAAPLMTLAREDDLLDASEEGLLPAPSHQAWHAFPRGAMPGNFLHDQLEWLAGEDFALERSEALREQLLRRCERQGWGHRAAEVLAWLREVVSQPLAPLGAALDSLRTRLPEMEFWFPSEGLAAADIDRLCREHLLGDAARPVLPQRELHGMLMGFADLVFLHEGRYWVLDYKSNYLGARDADYHAAALEAAMAQHRYDVQAGLYLLALHRLLRARLGDAYDPRRQLGGAVYLFLRGIKGPQNGCYHVPADPAFLDALDRAVGQPREGAA